MLLNFNKLASSLKKLKIKEKFILIHTDLHNYKLYAKNLDKFWKTILNSLGHNKTFIVPCFTTSFVKSKIWDKKNSKSQTGIFSEYFRKKISNKRTNHPIHSVAIWGKNFKKIPEHNCKSSFGKGSTWQWICNSKDVCNLSIGISIHGGATILHYPEELLGVKYRYYKKISGKITLENGKKIKKNYFFFARKIYKNKIITNKWERCEKDLINSNILKKKIYFKKLILCKMNTNKATRFVLSKIKNDPNYLITSKAKLFNKNSMSLG